MRYSEKLNKLIGEYEKYIELRKKEFPVRVKRDTKENKKPNATKLHKL